MEEGFTMNAFTSGGPNCSSAEELVHKPYRILN
jgi:hypothetical protein